MSKNVHGQGVRRRLAMSAWGVLVAAGALGGCSGGASTDYESLYQAQRYNDALIAAENKANATTGSDHDRAALTAGLAAYGMGETKTATLWLTPLKANSNPEIAGRANWTLGQMAADRGNYGEASVLLTRASKLLKGDDAARAAMQAGDAYRSLKNELEAQRQYAFAEQATQDAALKTIIAARQASRRGGSPSSALSAATLGAGPFTIQLGAYASRDKADAQARSMTMAAKNAGADEPKVVQTMDHEGRPLFAVRIGQYATLENAQRVLTRLGAKGVVVAASQNSQKS